MNASTPQKFIFDAEFTDDGQVSYSQFGVKAKTYTEEDVAEAWQTGFSEGEASALAVAAERQVAAIEDLIDVAKQGLHALAQSAHEHKAGAAELALVCARKIADVALDHAPNAVITAAIEALAREVEAQPRLILRTPNPTEEMKSAIEAAAQQVGLQAQILLRPEPSAAAGAFIIEWPDGKASFDPEQTAIKLLDAIRSALSAEGLHGEANLSGDLHG